MKKEYRFPALIVLAGIITFINSLANTFVGDDKAFNYFSPFERPMYSLSYMFGLSGQAVYRPFHFLYFNIISVLSQGNPAILHGIQVGLHIACALLLYALLRKFIHNTLALILSLMFVVHPVNSETVNYLAASSDILVFLFGILALR